ncbi:filamentous hemagglutinin N-terminal domain-containing protein [Sphingomonas sp. R-74633]|uniref:YDG domain-containing protein n=1 Tax=Sphingomonas sp. R-74633 TaxID=2751188 RepID=UPI0015D308C7|nr:YDG domain-containing protein [Sphingomonas sp. R-74633]NYT40317.1 filamentous hemagglutinin N-terminal domain-containing protein [Sphingomonas sp. R-74633]
MSAPRRRSSRLFTTSAFGALALAVFWAAPAQAQLVQGATPAQSNGSAPTINQAGNTTTVTLGGSRTVVDWDKFDINSGDTANFVFANRSDIVLNRVGGAGSTINGNLNGTIGSTGGAVGGNIWIYNANGVVIGANARISTGGLLVTTAAVDRATDSSAGGFLDGNATQFGFTGAATDAGITVQNGAQITSHGGAIALVSTTVTAEAGSSISAQDGGNVLIGGAAKYKISFRPTSTDDMDLLSFEVASAADGTNSNNGTSLAGAISGNRVFVATIAKTGLTNQIINTGTITATDAALDETGAIVLSTGHNIVGGAASDATFVTDAGYGDLVTGTGASGALTASKISLLAANTLYANGTINAGTGTVDMVSHYGGINNGFGANNGITAGTLTAAANYGISLQSNNNHIAKIGGLTVLDSSNLFQDDIYVQNEDNLEIAGDLRTAANITLVSQGSSFSGTGTLYGANAAIIGRGLVNLDTNTTLNGVDPLGALEIRSNGDLKIALDYGNTARPDALTLTASNGAIRQIGGAGLAGSVIANALGEIDLGGANSFTSLTANSTGGERVTVNATGNLDFKVNTFSVARFTVGGDATSSGTNALVAGGLNVTAGGAINLSSDGGDAGFGDLSAGGNITLAMDGNLVLGGVIQAGGALSLTSRGGAIRQTSGTISLGTGYTLNAATGIDLNQTGNHLGNAGSNVSEVMSGNGSNVRIRGDALNLNFYGTLGDVSLYGESGNVVVNSGLVADSLTVEAAGDMSIGSQTNKADVTTYHRLLGTNISVWNDGDFTVDGDVGRADVGRVELVAPNGTLTQAAGTIFGADISLRATYAINQDSGASVQQTSNSAFEAIAGTDLLLAGANRFVFPLLTWGANANVTIHSVGDLYVDNVTSLGWLVPLHALKLISDEGYVEVYGGFTADTLNVQAHGNITLDNADFIVSNVGSVTGLTSATGNISLREDDGFTIDGDISAAAGNITLKSDGAIETYSGALSLGGTLAVTAGGGTSLTGAGDIKLGDVSTAGGNFYLGSNGNIELTGEIRTGPNNVILATTNGAIASNGGTISAWTTTADATGAISLAGSGYANIWATSTGGGDIHLSGDSDVGFAVNTTGKVTVTSGGSASGNGDQTAGSLGITAAGAIDLQDSSASDIGSIRYLTAIGGYVRVDLHGDIKLDGNVSAGSAPDLYSVSLISSGSLLQNSGTITGDAISLQGASAITQASGATLHGTTLSITSSGNVSLGQANDFASIAYLAVGGDLTLRNLGSIDLDPTVGGGFTFGGALNLTSDTGDITAGNSVNTVKLTASAVNGSILLGGGGNLIDSLGALTAGGDIEIGTSTAGFNLTGDITATSMSLLVQNGGITQNAGTKITAGTLNVSADGIITLDQANAVATVGGLNANLFTTGHNVTFRNDGNITLGGVVDATGGTLRLTSNTGGISQNSGAGIYVRADQLFLSGASDLLLNSTNNNIATLGGATSTNGGILYRDANGFDIAGNITANATNGGVSLRTAGAGSITQSGGIIDVNYLGVITVGSGNSVTLNQANRIHRLISTSGNGTLSINSTTDLLIDQSVYFDTISLSSGGAITQSNTGTFGAGTANLSAVTGINLPGAPLVGNNGIQNFGTITNTTSGGINIVSYSGSHISLTGNISAAGQTVSITDLAGYILQTGGVITADTLAMSATGGINVQGANQVSNLGAMTTPGNVNFANAGSFNVTQSIDVTGAWLLLTSNSGAITQNAGTTLTADTIALSAGTTISQGAGATLQSTDLSLTSGGTTTLGEANDFTKITGLDVGGDLTLRNLGLIDLSPGFASYSYRGGGALTLISDTSSVLSTNSGVITSRLTASGVGSVNLSGAIASVGDVSANSISLWTYNGDMALTGNITGINVTLGSEQGSLSQTGGIIDASRLNVTTDGSISLTGANQIDLFGGLNTDKDSSGTYHDITIRNVGGIVLDYLVQGAGATVDLTSDTGGISQTSTNGGFITAGTLKANAAGDIVLDQAANDFDHLGAIRSTGGAVTIVDADAFDLTGQVRAAGALSLTSGGAITTANNGLVVSGGLLNVNATSANLAAGNNILLGTVTTNGNFAIDTDQDITVAGLLNTNGGDATLAANLGTIGHGATGTILANKVTATASGNISLDSTGNAVVWASSSNGGNINLTGDADIFFKIDTAGDLTVDAGGMAGNNDSVIARSVGINATGGISMYDQTVTINVGSYRYLTTANGFIDIENQGDINLDGDVTANGGTNSNYVRLNSSLGSLLQNSGTISGYSVELDAAQLVLQDASAKVVVGDYGLSFRATDVSLLGANEFPWLNTYTVTHDLTLRVVGSLDMSGSANQAGSNHYTTLISDTGNIIGGPIDADMLSASAANGSLSFTYGNNRIRSLGDLTAKSTGGTDIEVFTDSTLGLTGNITGGGVILHATQGINQTGGVITADRLAAGTSGNLLLGGANNFGALTEVGHGNGTTVTIRNLGSILLPSTLQTFGTLTLTSDTGSIGQTDAITAATLIANAATGITLNSAGNNFTTLAGLTTGTGDIRIGDTGGFAIEGNLTAATGTVALASTGNITTGTTTVGTVTTPHGKVDADMLTVSAVNATVYTAGDIKLGASAVSSGFTLVADGSIDLAATSNFNGASLIATAGSITQSTGILTGNTVLTAAAGSITLDKNNNLSDFGGTSNGGGNVTFNNVNANPSTFSVNTTGNAVITAAGNLQGFFVTANDLSVTAGHIDLTNNTHVNSFSKLVAAYGDVFVTNAGSFTISGDVSARKMGLRSVNLYANGGGISQTGGTISAHVVTLRGNGDVAQSGTGRIDANVTELTGVNLDLMGANSFGTVVPTTIRAGGNVRLNGDVLSLQFLDPATDVTLSSAGDITVNSAGLQASSLTANAGGALSIAGNNQIATVHGLSGTSIDFASTGFTLDGNVTATTSAALTATSGDLEQTAGTISAVNASLFAMAGSITQSGTGKVAATSLIANSGGDLILGGANSFTGAGSSFTYGDGSTPADVTIRNLGSINFTGISGEAIDALSLTSDGGAISQTGAVSAASVSLSAATGIDFSDSANALGMIAGLANSTSGNIVFATGGNLSLAGNVTATGQNVWLSATGAITQASGAITATSFRANANTGLTLTSTTNNVANITGLTNAASGGIAYTDADSFNITGDINALGSQALSLVVVNANATVNQTTGLVTAGKINLSGGQGYSLRGNAGTYNQIGRIGDISAIAQIYTQGSVDLTGTINAPYFELWSRGDVTQSGGQIINTAGNFLEVRANNITLDRAANQLGDISGLITGPTGTITVVSDGDTRFGSLQGGTAVLTVTNGSIGNLGDYADIDTLNASSSGGIDLGGRIGALGNVSAGGDSAFRSSTSLNIAGQVNVGAHRLAISSGGDLSYSYPSGSIITDTLVANAIGDIFLNQIDSSGSVLHVDLTGNMVSLVGARAVDILGLTAQSGEVITNGGALTQSGAIQVHTLMVRGDSITLNDPTNSFSSLLANVSAGTGDISIVSATGFSINRNILTTDTVSLTALGTGSISQGVGTVTAGTLNLNAGGDLDFNLANAVGIYNATAANGHTITLRNQGNLVVNAITAQNGVVNLASNAGSVGQLLVPGNSIWTGRLNVTQATDIDLGAYNFVDVLGNLTASGSINYNSFVGLTLDGVIHAGGALTMGVSGYIGQTNGAITADHLDLTAYGIALLSANDIGSTTASNFTASDDITFRSVNGILLGIVNTPGLLSLTADSGDIRQTGGILADRLDASAAAGDVVLDQANAIGTLNDVTAGGGFTFNTSTGLTLDGRITAPDLVQITAGGNITQTGVQAIHTDVLLATSGAGAANGISLLNHNQVGSATLNSNGKDLRFRNAGNFALGNINAAGHIVEMISDTGSVTQQAGTSILAGTFSATGTNVDLSNAGNQIGRIGLISTGSDLTLNNGVALQIDAINAGAHNVTINNTSDITGGNITANLLTVNTSNGVVGLNTANHVNSVGAFNGYQFEFVNDGSFTIAGAFQNGMYQTFLTSLNGSISMAGGSVNSGAITVQAATGISLTGNLSYVYGATTTTGDVSIVSGLLDIQGDISGDSVTLGGVANGGFVRQTSGSITANLLNLNGYGDIDLNGATNHIASLGTVNTTVGHVRVDSLDAVALTDNIDVADTFTLNAGGAVTQTGGRIKSIWLDVTGAGDITLDAANLIDSGGSVRLFGDNVTFVNDGTFTIDQINAGAHAIDLTSTNGNIWQSGVMVGGSLTASAHGSLSLNRGNAIDYIGALSAGTELTYNSATAYTLTDDITAGTTVTLNGAAGINQTDGTISGQSLSVAAGSADLRQANTVGQLGAVTTSGDFLFRNVGDIELWGNNSAVGGTFGLYSDTGGISNPGALFTANIIDFVAAGSVDLNGGSFNYIDNLTSANGDITLVTGSHLLGANLIDAAQGTVDLTVDGITANSVRANLLRIDATGSDVEMLGDNVIAHLGNIFGENISLAVGETDITGWLHGSNSIAFIRSGIASDFALTMASGGAITTPMISLSNTGTAGTATLSNITTPSGTLELNFNFNGDADVTAATSAISLNNAVVDGDLSLHANGAILNTGAPSNISGTITAANNTGDISLLFGADNVGHFGNISAFNGTVHLGANSVDLTGAIIAGGQLLELEAGNGSVTQAAGSVITSDRVEGGSASDFLLGGANHISTLGAITAFAGNILVATDRSLTIDADITTDVWQTPANRTHSVSLISTVASGPAIQNSATGILHTGTLNIQAIGDVVLTNQDIVRLGLIDPTLFSFSQAADFDITTNIVADAVVLSSTAGQITQSGGVITASSTTLSAQNGISLLGANHFGSLSLTTLSGDIAISNVGNLVLASLTSPGNASVIVSGGGTLAIGSPMVTAAGNLWLEADGTVSISSAIDADGDVAVMSHNGAVNLFTVQAGDDISVSADAAHMVSLAAASIGSSGNDDESDGHNMVFSGGGVTLGASTPAGITTANKLLFNGATGSVTINGGANGATVNLDSMDQAIDIAAAGGNVQAQVNNDDLLLGTVSGANVTLVAANNLQMTSVTVPGVYSITAGDFSAGAFNILGGSPLDIFVTDTAGNLTLSGDLAARRNATVTAQAGNVLGSTTRLGAGLTMEGMLTVNGANIDLLEASSLYDVKLNGTGTVNIGNIAYVGRDYTLTGSSFTGAALAPIGTRSGTWTLASLGALDMGGTTLEYNGGIDFSVAGLLNNGTIHSLSGAVTGSANSADVYEILAATDLDVSTTNGAFTVFHAAATSGSATLRSNQGLTVTGSIEAGTDVGLSAQFGPTTAGYASAGGDISVYSLFGSAILRQATLTGATGDLTVQSVLGSATLGADDYASIGNDNYFERAAGSSGNANVIGSAGAFVNLDHSATLNLVQANHAVVNVLTGDLTIGLIQGLTGDATAYLGNGSLTVNRALGDSVDLQAVGGDLTLGGGGISAGDLYLNSTGTIDTTAIANLSAGGFLYIEGGTVRAASLSAGGNAEIYGDTGGVTIDALGASGDLTVGATGNLAINQVSVTGYADLETNDTATIRGLTALNGFQILAQGNVTLGADAGTVADLTNTVSTGGTLGGCGCGGGWIASAGGDVSVNLLSVTGVLDGVNADAGDASIAIQSGDLGINRVRGYNIAVSTPGVLTMFDVGSRGGSFALTAADFGGDALQPTLAGGAAALGDVTIIDIAGDLGASGTLNSSGDILVQAQGGAITGSLSLGAQGSLTVIGQGVHLLGASGHNVAIDAGTGTLDIVSALSVDNDYTLTAGDFAGEALAPAGSRAGSLSITDTVGDFNFGSASLLFSGALSINAAHGSLNIGDLRAGSAITLTAGGNLSLASATLIDPSSNALSLTAGGDLQFGAADNASITMTNVLRHYSPTLGGSSIHAGGNVVINLYQADGLGAIDGGTVQVAVRTGDLGIGNIDAVGAIAISGPSGTLTLGDVTTGAGHIDIAGQGDVTLGDVSGHFVVNIGSAAGRLAFGNLSGGDVSLAVARGITGASVSASTLGVVAANGNVDLDLNGSGSHVASLGAVTVNGDFELRNLGSLGLDGVIEVSGLLDLGVAGALTQNSGYIVADTLQGNITGAATLGGDNRIAVLGDLSSQGLKLNTIVDFVIGGTVQAGGGTVVIAARGGMTIAGGASISSSAAGDAITLASDGLFTNLGGANALGAANGRWLVYTQAGGNPGLADPNNDFGGLAGTSYYGDAYNFATGSFASAPNAGNRFVYGYRPVLTVTPSSAHVIYDGTTPQVTMTITDLVHGDSAADAWSGTADVSGVGSNAGTYFAYSSIGTLASEMGYTFAFVPGTVIIDPRVISAVLNANDRTYDGTTAATGTLTLNGVIAGDTVTANVGTMSFDNRNAGIGRTVTAGGITLSGASAGNYTVSATATDLADILARAITATLTANDRTYDGTTNATGMLALNGVLGTDDVSAAGATLAFDNKNAGTRTVTASGITLTGADAGNYIVSANATDLADILARAITATLTANDRIYDGTAAATGSLSLTGVLGNDQVTANGNLTFDSRNAGTGRAVTANSISLSGSDAGNYTVNASATDLADILARAITATLTANDRTYDGTITATGSLGLTGLVSGDSVSASAGNMAFDNGNAGTGRTVTASGITLSGADAGNYSVNVSATDLADILARAITATLTANGRVYDGTTIATGTLALNGVLSGDQVTVSAGGIAFDSRNAGTRTATASGLTLGGANAANYTITGTATGSAVISQRAITGIATADSRVYDGTTAATGRIALTGVISGDTVTGTATYRFADANAGTGRTVQVSGLGLSGADAGNYSVSLAATPVTADITRRAVTVTINDATKILGQPDPVFGYAVSSGSVVNGDSFAGAPIRAAGDQVGHYAIGQGTLALSANYLLTVIPGTLVISLTQSGADASDALKMLQAGVGVSFSVNQDPSRNLEGDGGQGAEGDGAK